MTRSIALVALLLLASCTASGEPPDTPRTWLVWHDNDGVFALDGDKPHRLGSYPVGEVAIAPDGATGAAVVSDNSLGTDAELVVWSTNGTERRVPCGACIGAVIAGDEVRTADDEGNYIRRFNRWDGRFLGTVLAPPPRLEQQPVVAPQEVVAATPELTVLRYRAAEPTTSDALYAMDSGGSVRWEHAFAGERTVLNFTVDPTGTVLASASGWGEGCRDMESRPVLLDLASGQVIPTPDLPVDPTVLSSVRDLSWNGPDLVVVSWVTARTDTTCVEDLPSTVSELRGDQWHPGADTFTAQLRALPGGKLVHVSNPMNDLEISDGGTTRALAGGASILTNLPSRTPASLAWPG
ncbi:hypothetical protein [Actinokineospora cianjurensis]|uniref:Lipoprotein n=1 Tax=Actinokineospora cianjurensis TaxID=585224 RepID=A0A421B3T3_9PSEU|nr:hypothetical protein [Actinokineospora cianjurensis]RLK58950.1 hypothetical protein CLV68_3431 [Actinokineospora cianjurensis]